MADNKGESSIGRPRKRTTSPDDIHEESLPKKSKAKLASVDFELSAQSGSIIDLTEEHEEPQGPFNSAERISESDLEWETYDPSVWDKAGEDKENITGFDWQSYAPAQEEGVGESSSSGSQNISNIVAEQPEDSFFKYIDNSTGHVQSPILGYTYEGTPFFIEEESNSQPPQRPSTPIPDTGYEADSEEHKTPKAFQYPSFTNIHITSPTLCFITEDARSDDAMSSDTVVAYQPQSDNIIDPEIVTAPDTATETVIAPPYLTNFDFLLDFDEKIIRLIMLFAMYGCNFTIFPFFKCGMLKKGPFSSGGQEDIISIENIDLPLFYVSNFISQHARSVFYSYNTFAFSHPEAAKWWLNTIGASNRSFLRSFTLDIRTGYTNHAGMEACQERQWQQYLTSALGFSLHTHLTSLCITLRDWRNVHTTSSLHDAAEKYEVEKRRASLLKYLRQFAGIKHVTVVSDRHEVVSEAALEELGAAMMRPPPPPKPKQKALSLSELIEKLKLEREERERGEAAAVDAPASSDVKGKGKAVEKGG